MAIANVYLIPFRLRTGDYLCVGVTGVRQPCQVHLTFLKLRQIYDVQTSVASSLMIHLEPPPTTLIMEL